MKEMKNVRDIRAHKHSKVWLSDNFYNPFTGRISNAYLHQCDGSAWTKAATKEGMVP